MSSFAENRRPPTSVSAFGLGLCVLTAGFAVGLILSGATFGPLFAVLILGAFSMLAERRPVRVNANVELTVSLLPVVFAAVVFHFQSHVSHATGVRDCVLRYSVSCC